MESDPHQQYAKYYLETYLPSLADAKVDLYVWQNHANEVLLWSVVFLSSAGVALAAVQLIWSMWKGYQIGDSQAEISAKAFKVASPFVGVLILVISFSFFIVFVREVYTIRDPSSGTPRPAAAAVPAAPITPQDDPY